MAGETVLVIDDSPTILKVVQLVLTKAGFQVDTAADGESGLESARRAPPDLILLDFVMPKMNGYQVCRALAQEPQLAEIPVVLMSAKGDQVGERFVKVMGIVDYITKPFSPEAITAVVQHTVDKYGAHGQGPDEFTKQILTPPSLDAAAAEMRTEREAAATQQRVLRDLRDRIAERIATPLANLHSLADAAREADGGDSAAPVPIDAETVAEAARQALDDEALRQLFLDALPALEDAEVGPSLRGDVRVVPIAEVLQLLDAQNQTGILQVTRGAGKIEVYFRDGRVDLACATEISDEFLLGRFIVDAELMTAEDLAGFLDSRVPGSKLIGTQLSRLGYLSEGELEQVLQTQTRELVYELLRWNFGSFRFARTSDLPAPAAEALLGLDVEGILMEGFRRVDEWHLIEREIDDFETVFLRNEDAVAQMGRGRLTREELTVLELVNGKNTVKEIVRESRMGSFEVSKMLYRLLSIKLIRRRVQPVAV